MTSQLLDHLGGQRIALLLLLQHKHLCGLLALLGVRCADVRELETGVAHAFETDLPFALALGADALAVLVEEVRIDVTRLVRVGALHSPRLVALVVFTSHRELALRRKLLDHAHKLLLKGKHGVLVCVEEGLAFGEKGIGHGGSRGIGHGGIGEHRIGVGRTGSERDRGSPHKRRSTSKASTSRAHRDQRTLRRAGGRRGGGRNTVDRARNGKRH